MGIAIKVENLSKAYQLGEIGTGTISRDLERYWAKLRGKEDPFLKIGETNDRTTKGKSDMVWSLKDINFEIEQGDAVGIIGRNGAGKSTLLKILSRVTSPTTGSIKIWGRVASLLEVGTGFHPELTGRENIFLNGAILGMRKAEIKKHFDAIVDFAGVERYIDTPVKRYSSGMYVRLAFAVAAHLESEILVVDEVLAVGDAEFQKKCLGKMNDVSKGEGRTILFVSHDIRAIRSLCNNGILLQAGHTNGLQDISETILEYSMVKAERVNTLPVDLGELILHNFVLTQHGYVLEEFESDFPIQIEIDFEARQSIKGLRLGVFIRSNNGELITAPLLGDWQPELENIKIGRYVVKGEIPANFFIGGNYTIEVHGSIHGMKNFLCENYTLHILRVKSPSTYNINHIAEQSFGNVILNTNWKLEAHYPKNITF